MPYKILLADDNVDFRNELTEALSEYEFVHASSGDEAVKMILNPHEIDLIILDVFMPGLKGTQALKKIKTIEPEMKVIILTGAGSKEIVIDSLKEKADDYWEKPINVDTVKPLIKDYLKNREENIDSRKGGIKSKMEHVKRFTERNYYKKVSLKDAARAVSQSPKYLSRIFKQYTGKGFNQYKFEIIISKAKELLDTTEFNIDQISYKMGYQNTESFIRIFKKITGQTPTEYRSVSNK